MLISFADENKIFPEKESSKKKKENSSPENNNSYFSKKNLKNGFSSNHLNFTLKNEKKESFCDHLNFKGIYKSNSLYCDLTLNNLNQLKRDSKKFFDLEESDLIEINHKWELDNNIKFDILHDTNINVKPQINYECLFNSNFTIRESNKNCKDFLYKIDKSEKNIKKIYDKKFEIFVNNQELKYKGIQNYNEILKLLMAEFYKYKQEKYKICSKEISMTIQHTKKIKLEEISKGCHFDIICNKIKLYNLVDIPINIKIEKLNSIEFSNKLSIDNKKIEISILNQKLKIRKMFFLKPKNQHKKIKTENVKLFLKNIVRWIKINVNI